jgi:hypothetical protein
MGMADFLTGMSDMSDQYVDMTNYHTVTNNQTNGDSVRSMSNEQIAGVACTGCPPGVENERCDSVLGGEGSCYNCWLHWLQSPVEGCEDDRSRP